MYCSNCGKEIPSQSRFCKWCGATISPAQTQQGTQETQDNPTGRSAPMWFVTGVRNRNMKGKDAGPESIECAIVKNLIIF